MSDRTELLLARLEQLIQQVHMYVGARYVPRFLDDPWDPNNEYEPLDVVDNGSGTSYIAKKPVPVGILLSDRQYWFVYGSTSGAIINLQNQIDAIVLKIQNLTQGAINVLYPDSSTGLNPATGDGVTDDTTNLNAIIQYALTHDKNVYFPRGTYNISSITINFTSDHKTINLFGDGKQSKILVSGTGIIMQNTTEASVPNYCKVENLHFYGASTSGTRLLQFINVFNGLIQNCLFEHADIGLLLGSNIWSNIINCRFNNCSWDNVYMCGVNEDNRCLYAGNNAVNFYGCVSYGAGRDGFECVGNSGCNFYGCTSESNGACGIRMLKSGSFNGRGNLVSGSWFEFNPSGHINIDSANDASDCNYTVSDCGFVSNNSQSVASVSITGTNGAVLVSGCHFRRMSGSSASVSSSPNVRSIHNRYSYTPTYSELAGEHTDTTHCRINSNASILYNTRDITGATRNSTGNYTVTVNHWVNSVAANAEQASAIASCVPANQGDGTCNITVLIRDLSNNLADLDAPFSIIAM